MNRFDLEQQIQACWNTKDDIDLLSDAVQMGDLSNDDIINVLLGISQLHEMRCKKVFDTFSHLVHSGVIAGPDNSELYYD